MEEQNDVSIETKSFVDEDGNLFFDVHYQCKNVLNFKDLT